MPTLTEAHRLAQLRLGAQTISLLRPTFRLLDPNNIDGTAGDWLAVAIPIIEAGRETSSAMAAAYVSALREGEVGDDDDYRPAVAGPVSRDRLTTSLLVTGPHSLRSNLARSVPLARALEIAEARSSAAGMRHVLDAGRETVVESVRADRRSRGWRRVTSANPCAFCAMLESRGAVYGADTSSFASHDGCGCEAEPVYD